MTENRIHGKALLNPPDYAYVGAYDNNPPPPIVTTNGLGQFLVIPSEGAGERENRLRLRKLLAEHGHDDYACVHCGAHIRYVIVWRHTPSGEVICTGQTCADDRMESADRAEMDARILVKNAAARAEAFRVSQAAQKWVGEHEALAAEMLECRGDEFVRQMILAVSKYGELTEKQLAATVRACAKVRDWMVDGATCELREFVEAPTGKAIAVEGQVMKAEWRDDNYGGRFVMTVKTEAGWIAWGTIPSLMLDTMRELVNVATDEEREAMFPRYSNRDGAVSALAGQRVAFVADLTRGGKGDLAFVKRPRKAELISIDAELLARATARRERLNAEADAYEASLGEEFDSEGGAA